MKKEETAAKKTHQHGGSPACDFERLGIVPRPVTDFSVNINPLGPPQAVIDAWPELSGAVTTYPSIDGDGVRRFYETRFALPRESVLPGNGSIELIYLLPRALNLKRVLVLAPSFHDYQRAASIAGTEVVAIPFAEENGFGALSETQLEKHLAAVDAVCIGNPNNPTGTVFLRELFLYLADKYPEKWFMVDEAFVQFVENMDEVTLITSRYLKNNIIIFHSLTKFYALPGLRLGAAISHPDTIARLMQKKEPWTVNGIAEKVAGILLNCGDYETRTRKIVCSEQERVFHRLNQTPGFRIFPPTANFCLAQWTGVGGLDNLLKTLLSNGLYVRDCRNFPGLAQNFFRFGIGMPADNDRLMDVLVDFAGGTHG